MITTTPLLSSVYYIIISLLLELTAYWLVMGSKNKEALVSSLIAQIIFTVAITYFTLSVFTTYLGLPMSALTLVIVANTWVSFFRTYAELREIW